MKLTRTQKITTIVNLFLIFFYTSCNIKIGETTVKSPINGRFVNQTFLEKTTTHLIADISLFCFEIEFINCDSVLIKSGVEEFKVAFKNEGNQYALINATHLGNMEFRLNHDSSITLIDTSWTKATGNSNFIKMKENAKLTNAFEAYYNQGIICREYTLYEKNKASKQKVIFTPDGLVKGLGNFTNYSICYGGDCIETTEPTSNIIYLTGKNEEKDFSFSRDKTNKTLKIYEIENGVEGIKGNRKVTNQLFDLRD